MNNTIDNKYYTVVAETKPNHTVTFNNGGKQIGSLDFNGDVMKFEGDADESAKIFFNYVAGYFDKRWKEERDKALEEAAKLREDMGALDAMEGEEIGSAAMVRVADRAFDLYEAAIRRLK